MTEFRVGFFLAGLLALLPVAGAANDRWEAGTVSTDANSFTHNELTHGTVQRGHDLEGAPDQDWMVVRAKARHSYEARVGSGSMPWTSPSCVGCATFDRVDQPGNVLTPGLADGATGSFQPTTLSVRWIAPLNENEYLRAVGQTNFTAVDTYDVEFYDTTYFLPRFNNSATQISVMVVQNTTDAQVDGNIYFYGSTGALLHTQPLSLVAQGLLVLNTASIGALAGQGGSASIAQLGGYGALAGKAVAVEPATGFTFDTALTAVPR